MGCRPVEAEVLASLSEVMGRTVQGHSGRWVPVEGSGRTGSTGGGNGRPLQYSCLENPVNSMKRQKNVIPEDEAPRSESICMILRKSREIAPERMKRLGQKWK